MLHVDTLYVYINRVLKSLGACLQMDQLCHGTQLSPALQRHGAPARHTAQVRVRVLVRLHRGGPVCAELRQCCRLRALRKPTDTGAQVDCKPHVPQTPFFISQWALKADTRHKTVGESLHKDLQAMLKSTLRADKHTKHPGAGREP